MTAGLQHRLFDAESLDRLRDLVELDPYAVVEHLADLTSIDVLITGWGCPPIGIDDLDRMPSLRAIIHAGGSVKQLVHPEVLDRGILVTNAAAANAIPVAEFTLAMALLAGKDTFRLAAGYRIRRATIDLPREEPDIGSYRAVVGIWGASLVGRSLAGLLKNHDFDVLIADPTIDDEQARSLGAELVDLDELFERSRVVCLLAPLIPATTHAIGSELLRRLPDGATLINTARGALVDQAALLAELRSGRIQAILDVTDPEPLASDDDLWDLPNIFLTPHVAGSQGNELRRLGRSAVDEVERLIRGLPPLHPVAKEAWATTA